MNIVIPYRNEPNNGTELRYALRSIEKHLTGYDEIFIVGDNFPTWLTSVNKIETHEESRKTARNILNKILLFFEQDGSKVLQWQDDIFLTKPLQVKEIKYWYDGNLEQAIYKHHGGYKNMIINTALKLTEEALFYDIHVPIIYEKEYFKSLLCYNWEAKTYLIKTLYCDIAKTHGEPMKDVKIQGPSKRHEMLDKVNNLFFSTSQEGVCPDMIEIFEQLYPDKSKYEV